MSGIDDRRKRFKAMSNNNNNNDEKDNTKLESRESRNRYNLYERFGSDRLDHEDRLIVIQSIIMSLLFYTLNMLKKPNDWNSLLLSSVLFTLLFWTITKYFLKE
jgi:hypothetical protein